MSCFKMGQTAAAIEDRDEIEVKFVDDQSVVHIINDECLNQNNSLNNFGTPKCLGRTSRNIGASIKSTKKKQTLDDDNDEEEYSENETNLIQKPKALFEEGDIPGERMFSFHSKQNKSSSQKTPTSKKKRGCRDNNEIDHDMCNIQPQVLFDDENDTESKPSTRASTKSTILQSKNEVLKNGSSCAIDNKFGYKTSKKAKIVQNMSSSKTQKSEDVAINSTPKTPKSEKYPNSKQILAKTPRVVRKNIAKGIEQQKFEQLNELNDSDYSISDSTDENDSDSSMQPKENSTQISLRKSTRKKEIPFMYKAEEYFLAKSTKSLKKSKTSDNTLKLLKNPVLEQGQVDKLSGNSNIIHSKNLKAMYKNIVSNFPYWLCLLKEGFNLLLYGFGSKRQIINDFRTAMLEKECALVINGFFPGLTLKEILESITIDLLDLESCPGSAELSVQLIEETQKLKNAKHLFILIHNLDGVELQNYKIQHVLSRICSLKNVHLIASIDRVNAALMYDNTKLGDYNFLWMDCTNYSPYTVETRFIEPLMVKNTGSTHALSGLNNFFKSLTSNAKRILLLIIKNHIENKNNKKHAGVPFSILYRWCRQQFLVSTDLALRSQLVEFVDHEVVKWKRDADVLHVPVDIEVLVQFYKQNEEEDE